MAETMSKMSSFYVISALATFIFVSCNIPELKAQLEVGYYANTCAKAEHIVKDEVRNAFHRDPGLAAGLVRLHFHDCFIRVSIFKSHCKNYYLVLHKKQSISEFIGTSCVTRSITFFYVLNIVLNIFIVTKTQVVYIYSRVVMDQCS